MTKIAKLVTFEITTRIIVNDDNPDDSVAALAFKQALDDMKQNGPGDSLLEIKEDKECPFGSFDTDRI